MRWAGYAARLDEGRDACRVLVGRPEGMRRFGRPRYKWENNIKMNLQEMRWGSMDWVYVAQDRAGGGLL
jgi:hypothetical protein